MQSILMTPMLVAYCAGMVVGRSDVVLLPDSTSRTHTSTPSITFFGVTVFPHRLQKYGVIDPVRHEPPPPEPESRPGLKWDLERFGIMGLGPVRLWYVVIVVKTD